MNHRVRAMLAVVLAVGVVAATGASAPAASRLTHARYQGMLNRANVAVTRAETAAQQGLTPKATFAQARALLLRWANTETRLGKSFKALTPPRDAVRGNTLLSQGELMFGAELAWAANHLPNEKAKVQPFLESRLGNAKGARKIDAALSLLKSAGYRG
jgi:hypothetical protein